MKTLCVATAALLFATAGGALASTTRIQFHSRGCAAIVDFSVLKSGVLAKEESDDGCSPNYYYGLGSKAKVKSGPAILVGAVDTNYPGGVFLLTIQYPFVTGGTFTLKATADGNTEVSVSSGNYAVLQ